MTTRAARLVSALGIALLTATASGPARAATIVEYPLPGAARCQLGRIRALPDGNLWSTEPTANVIGRITPAGIRLEFTIPTTDSGPADITWGPDGNVWFTENGVDGNKIGRMTPAGVFTEFPLPTPDCGPEGITAGPDGNVWFTELRGNKIGRITPGGVVTEFSLPARCNPNAIIVGPDGNLWFTEVGALTTGIGRITPEGLLTEFATPTPRSSTYDITSGPDGNLWFTEPGSGQIGRITPAGIVTEFPAGGIPFGIASGPDGNLWFTMSPYFDYHTRVRRMTPAGVLARAGLCWRGLLHSPQLVPTATSG